MKLICSLTNDKNILERFITFDLKTCSKEEYVKKYIQIFTNCHLNSMYNVIFLRSVAPLS